MPEMSGAQIMFKQCAGLQDGILDCAAAMLKGGGRIVYSTCTFSPEENEQSIARFLERHPEFSVVQPELAKYFSAVHPEWADGNEELKKTVRIWPHLADGEGAFPGAACERCRDPGMLWNVQRTQTERKTAKKGGRKNGTCERGCGAHGSGRCVPGYLEKEKFRKT